MTPITEGKRQVLLNKLQPQMSQQARLSATISVIEELRKLDVDPTSLGDKLPKKIQEGLGWVITTTHTNLILQTTAYNALSSFDAWMKQVAPQCMEQITLH